MTPRSIAAVFEESGMVSESTGRVPPFTAEDFFPSKEKRAAITAGLTDRQAFMVNRWIDNLETLNRHDWEGMDQFFDTDKMQYSNPNRPDLGSYWQWKSSPQGLARTMPPSHYRVLKAWGQGENEICVLCHHHGSHTGGPYMGVQPTGNEINVLWFSWMRFEGDKIVFLYSISDVLTMLKDFTVIKDIPQPIDPYK